VRQSIQVDRPASLLSDGRFDALRVLTNGLRFGRDGAEYLAMGYDRGLLPGGASPDGFWEWLEDGSALEVRIPWALINVTDPSSRRVVRIGAPANKRGELATTQVDGVRLVLGLRAGETWHSLPATGRAEDIAQFSWATWEQPEWTSRRRPIFEAMREAYRALDYNLATMEGTP
jgi:hypothetical protein